MENSIQLLIDAFQFASYKHRFQFRKGENHQAYIVHPAAVCKILSDSGVTDVEILCGALLHDTVEDTQTTFEELEEKFGPKITQYVRELTDDKSLDKISRKKSHLAEAYVESKGAQMINLADRINNCESLIESCPMSLGPHKKAQGYIVWSKKIADAVKGTNPNLDKRFEDLLTKNIHMEDGSECPALPDGDLDVALEEYYEMLVGLY